MTLRISLIVLAGLLFITLLAMLSGPAAARTAPPEDEAVVSSRIMTTGPLNVVVFRVSAR